MSPTVTRTVGRPRPAVVHVLGRIRQACGGTRQEPARNVRKEPARRLVPYTVCNAGAGIMIVSHHSATRSVGGPKPGRIRGWVVSAWPRTWSGPPIRERPGLYRVDQPVPHGRCGKCGAGALDPDTVEAAKAAPPRQQPTIAGRSRPKLMVRQVAADLIHDGRVVNVAVSVHAADHVVLQPCPLAQSCWLVCQASASAEVSMPKARYALR
jgi:hypothetical protein